ncbi:GntR family transcriptional regulator [Sphingosinicella rhizophila]|uniref:GntR family transcriptional regulator n=1 Tax=Sphingosinicella rhizophila TaxID=3050082 RepID=A0ABU3QBW6_9SPHN|nr:GntR family transcriptional regulator [Sphingosinicella sp. GR2756]MDT9600493.1 GntR family transcriptional regulator [Sphingosinicella sp. GR2756]
MNREVFRLQPIDTSTLHERAYLQLRNGLMAGLFRPGESVTLRGVADALGTSVMPIREAVRRLVSERALEMPNSRSIRVPSMSLAHFDELCACRLLLEGEAAFQAAARCSPALTARLADLDRQYGTFAAAGDTAAMLAANQAFHFTLYRAGGSELLFSMIETLWLQSGPYLNLFIASEDTARELGETVAPSPHKDLLTALRRKRGEAARAAIVADISDAAIMYRARIEALS